MSNAKCMRTTTDNPFNPFEDFSSWFMFDIEKGYNTCGRLMRIANIPDDFTEQEEDEEIERAIDTIIKYDVLDIYKKVTQQTVDS